MSKTWDTKNKILDLLGRKRMTLTDISHQLDLAPSTVNQHIQELLSMGAIRQVDNPFILKWKYYEPNPDFSKSRVQATRVAGNFMSNPVFRAIGVVFILGIVAMLLLGCVGSSCSGVPQSTNVQSSLAPGAVPSGLTAFTISDAPGAAAISAVNISVGSASIHSTTTGKWYTVFSSNTPKMFNLVKLRNTSQLLSGANLSAGSYDEVVLEVVNVSAVVNGTAKPVFLPSADLKIFGKFNLTSNGMSSNSGSNWVNIDFNLNRSIHITGSGKVILLPVINLLAESNASIKVGANANALIQKVREGSVDIRENESMDVDGNMTSNQTGVRHDEELEVRADVFGHQRIQIVNTSSRRLPITISTPHGLIIIANASTIPGVLANLSANVVVKVVGKGSGMSQGENVMCGGDGDGAIVCNAVGNIDDNELGSAIAENTSGIFGLGIAANASARGKVHVNSSVTIHGTGG